MEHEVSRALAKYKAPSSLRNWIEHDAYANALFFPVDLDSVETALVNGAMVAEYEEDDWRSVESLPTGVARKLIVLRRDLMKRKHLVWSESGDDHEAPVVAPWYKSMSMADPV